MLARTPWTTKPIAKAEQRKLKREQRERLVRLMANILCAGSTPFRFEAWCRYGIRSGLVLNGWRWSLADATAADVVNRALYQIGATRPHWIEGQRNFAQLGTLMLCDNCWHCGQVLLGNINIKYCSDACRRQFHSQVVRKFVRPGDAYQSAARMARGLDEQHNA